MSTGASGGKTGTVHVNVIPMIDMLIMLLIFLLSQMASSVFEDLAALAAKLPVFGPTNPEDEPLEEDPKKLKSLKVRMSAEKGFAIIAETGEGASQIDVPNKPDSTFDFQALSEELNKIKQIHEAHEDCLLEISKDIAYQDVILFMDAVRERVVITPDKQLMRTRMFPSVALSDLAGG